MTRLQLQPISVPSSMSAVCASHTSRPQSTEYSPRAFEFIFCRIHYAVLAALSAVLAASCPWCSLAILRLLAVPRSMIQFGTCNPCSFPSRLWSAEYSPHSLRVVFCQIFRSLGLVRNCNPCGQVTVDLLAVVVVSWTSCHCL